MNNNINNQVVPNGQPNVIPSQPQQVPVQPQPMVQPQIVQPQQVPVQPQPMVQPQMQGMPMNQPIPVQQNIPPQMIQTQPMPQQQIPVQPQTTLGPQFANPVAPIGEEETKEVTLEQEVVPNQNVQNSVVEENLAPSNTEQYVEENNNDNITIDYNQLYGINNDVKEEVVVEDNNDRHVFTEQEIVIETPSVIERKNTDVTPEFNINALDTNMQDTENKLTDNVLSDRQQDHADTRRKIMYLVVLFLLIAVCLIWVFPMLAGAN